MGFSSGVDVEMEGEDDDGIESEEDQGVYGHRLAVGLHVAASDVAVGPRDLAQQPGGEQHEENHAHDHRRPVCHLCCGHRR